MPIPPSQARTTAPLGSQVGRHEGLAYYTVGQRKGLGLAAHEPLHVLRLDPERNALVVGPGAALERDTFTVRQTTSIAGTRPTEPFAAQVKVRYKAPLLPALVSPLPGERAEVRLAEPQRAITPGQAAVFYNAASGEQVLGGGLIE